MKLPLDRSNWRRFKFGDVVRNVNESAKDPAAEGIDRIIAMEHLSPSELQINRWGDMAGGSTFTRRVRSGQTLFGKRRAYQRKAAYAEFDAICSGDILVFEAIESMLLPELLPFLVQSEGFYANAIGTSAGSLSPRTNWKDLSAYELDLPPLDQQQHIADLLWAAEGARQSSKRLMESSSRARLAWIEDRFTEFLRESSKPFRDCWRKGPQSGVSAPPVDRPTGHFVLSLAALGENGYREGQLKSVDRTAKMASVTLNRGDLLISRANTVDLVGRAAIFLENRRDVSFPDTMMRIDLVGEVLPEFIALVVMSPHGRAHMRKTAAGTNSSMAKINRTSLGSLLVPDLSLTDQRSILDEVFIFDQSISRLEVELEAQSQIRSLVSAAVFGEDS